MCASTLREGNALQTDRALARLLSSPEEWERVQPALARAARPQHLGDRGLQQAAERGQGRLRQQEGRCGQGEATVITCVAAIYTDAEHLVKVNHGRPQDICTVTSLVSIRQPLKDF